jgi:mono/diheme cytochrome c family protein
MTGAYLVHAEMCGLCHTPIDPTGIYRGDDFFLGGGMRVGAYPQGVFVSRNLTGDPETGLGRWSEAEIATAIRTGAPRGGMARDVPQRLLVAAQWVVVVAGVMGLVVAGPRGRRVPHTVRGQVLTALAAVDVVIVAVVAGVIVRLRALAVIPPAEIAAATAGRISRPDPARAGDPSRRELVERGCYLFPVASCALCHGNDGAGGAKLSWRPMDTVWARNLTPDRNTGLGAWTDAEIARAIRSGISKDGRTLRWQAMIWDHASNWDEEDLCAMIAFLHVLPPVRRAIPATRPPAADDCEVHTFWVDASSTPGCR